MTMDNSPTPTKFDPQTPSQTDASFNLPDELWQSILQATCTFFTEHFDSVILDLIKNPNLTSSYVFRAEIYYDSLTQTDSSLLNGLKAEYRPRPLEHGWQEKQWRLQRTIVRRMIPRNPQLDKSLLQTCHLLRHTSSNNAEINAVVMNPHVANPADIPWYHPTAHSVAIMMHSRPPSSQPQHSYLSVHYKLFDGTQLDTRLERTALHLLKTIHKHGQGRLAGYQKRVHHDLLVPQARFQDTYTRLKAMYAKTLIGGWVEQTDPGKHVFEDLGIAAFLIELWRDMYGRRGEGGGGVGGGGRAGDGFPGFVDIGCGNGVLVYVLRMEGYDGWGFDARRRKTWTTFPENVQSKLKELLLIPQPYAPLQENPEAADSYSEAVNALHISDSPPSPTSRNETPNPPSHNGIFPPGTFIISNHADELTGWTPLLAHLNNSPFIAIPCCSHDLSGARFRASTTPAKSKDTTVTTKSGAETALVDGDGRSGQLRKRDAGQPSAYASLCAWVERLAGDVGYVVEREMLRIPSTRNACIVGRKRTEEEGGVSTDKTLGERLREVREIVGRECGGVERAGKEWRERAEKVARSKGTCH